MRILFVTSDFPRLEARHAGGLLTINLVKHLARSHELYLLSFISAEELPHLPAARRYFREVRTVPLLRGWMSRLRRLPLVPVRPYSVVCYRSLRLRRELQDMVRRHGIDLVQFEHFHMGQYAKAVPPGVSKALVLLDVISPVLRQQVRISPGWKKYFYYREWNFSRYWEKWYAIWAGNVLVYSLKDKRVVDSWDVRVNTRVLPPLLDEDFFSIPENGSEPETLLFTGAMHRLVNLDAARRLRDEILPRIWQERPGARCFIVGHRPPPALTKLSSDRFIVTGEVERIEPFLARAEIFLVPLRVAGGIIVKILQAMAAGRPVVASRTANAGIGAVEEKEILIADRSADFAAQVLRLLNDPALGRGIGQAGREFVRQRLDPEAARREIDRIYQGLRSSPI